MKFNNSKMELDFRKLDEKINFKIEYIHKTYEESVKLIKERLRKEAHASYFNEYREKLLDELNKKRNAQIDQINELMASKRDSSADKIENDVILKSILANYKQEFFYFKTNSKINYDIFTLNKFKQKRLFDLNKLNKYLFLVNDHIQNSIKIKGIISNWAINELVDIFKLPLDRILIVVYSNFYYYINPRFDSYKSPYKMYIINKDGVKIFEKICEKEKINGIIKVSSTLIVRLIEENILEVYNLNLELVHKVNIKKFTNDLFLINKNEIAIKSSNDIIIYKINNMKVSKVYESDTYDKCVSSKNCENKLIHFDEESFYLVNTNKRNGNNTIYVINRVTSEKMLSFTITTNDEVETIRLDMFYSQVIVIDSDGLIAVYDLKKGNVLFNFASEINFNDLDFNELNTIFFNRKVILFNEKIDYIEI